MGSGMHGWMDGWMANSACIARGVFARPRGRLLNVLYFLVGFVLLSCRTSEIVFGLKVDVVLSQAGLVP